MISRLIPGMTNINLIAKVVLKGDKRQVTTKYGKTSVCDATLKDESGEISLTLWGDQIGLVKENQDIQISGAYVTEFKGELQLNVPKRGEIKTASPIDV